MKSKFFLIVLASLVYLFTGCKNELIPEPESPGAALKSSNAKIKIAVLSDLHYMSPEYIPENISANIPFQDYLKADANKLVEISDPIFRQTIDELKEEKPDVILIAGDLSCDGQKLNHEITSNFLKQFALDGTKIYVVPGNNDINNNNSKSYAGTGQVTVPNVNPLEFETIYSDFGYTGTVRDINSLSYLAKPYPNLWILGIDACKYSPAYKRSGVIKTATLEWIKANLVDASDNNVTVMAVMHHNLMEHFKNNISLNPQVVLDNWQTSLNTLADLGVKLVFTGHNHANDIVQGVSEAGNTIYDIETGSLITAPSPYRIMILDDNFIKIETRNITSINYSFPEGMDFVNYSNQANFERINFYYSQSVLPKMFGISNEVSNEASPFVVRGTMAYCAGDEWLSPAERQGIDQLGQLTGMSTVLHEGIYSFWTDLPPKDNKLHIKLK